MASPRPLVAVLGAGSAGIAAARQLCAHCSVTVYEQAADVGGTWLYDKVRHGGTVEIPQKGELFAKSLDVVKSSPSEFFLRHTSPWTPHASCFPL